MHILIATSEFVTETTYSGGVANCVADFARVLNRHGNKVTIVTFSDHNGKIEWENKIIVYQVCVGSNSFKYRIMNFFFPYSPLYVTVNKKIQEIAGLYHIDIIHYPSSFALALKRPLNIPATVMMSTYLPIFRQVNKPSYQLTAYNIKSHGKYERQLKKALYQVDTVFAPSQIVAKYTEYDTGISVPVIESPTLVNEYKLMNVQNADLLKDKKYLLFFGTLGYLKGVALIAQTLTDFLSTNSDIYFVFLGKQTYMKDKGKKRILAMDYVYSQLPREYHSRVLYMEATPDKALLYTIVKKATACVLPSRFDNMPNTCIEAMTLGKIVIGTRNASFDELIDDGVNGFLIDIDNKYQLLDKMNKVLSLSDKEIESIGEKAKRTIDRLNPEVIYPQLYDFYQYTIDKHFENR